MAVFDDIKGDLSDLFSSKEVVKIDPGKTELSSKSGSAQTPKGGDFPTKEVNVEETEYYSEEVKEVNYDQFHYETPETISVNAETPEGYIPPEVSVSAEIPEIQEIQVKEVVSELPEGYSSNENPIVVESPGDFKTDEQLVVANPGNDASKYKSDDGVIVPPKGARTTTKLINARISDKEYSKDPKLVQQETEGWDNPGYETYTEGESSVTGIPRSRAIIETQDYTPEELKEVHYEVNTPSFKSELYQYLGNYMRGSTNLDKYGGSVKDVMDQLSSNLNLPGIHDTYVVSERIYQSFDGLVSAWKKGGFKGAVTNLFAQLNAHIATPIQSDAIVPAINRLIDSIPIIGMFTKQKYSLDLNKKTYKHEEVYNKAIDYQKSALKIYEGGMYGLYWYAKFYANHNISTNIQPLIMGRLTGNPEYSRPIPAIFNESVKDYVLLIGDAYDTSRAAEMVNMADFTTSDMVNQPKQVFNKARLNIQGVSSSLEFDDEGVPKVVKLSPINFKNPDYKIGKKGNPSKPGDTVIGFWQVSPKFNDGLGKYKVETKGSSAKPSYNHHTGSKRSSTYFRGWAEYVIETLGGKSTTTAGAIYVDPVQWKAVDQVEAGKEIKTLKDYEDYRGYLDTVLNDVSNKDMKYGDIYYGYYPYKWSQVFSNFEISSNGNWNVALSEFTGDLAEFSMFVPKDRPTYGPWKYMPIIAYEFMDKDLNSTSIPVSESLSLQIPSNINFVSTLQLTFIDDRYDRIFNWFTAYTNSIYGAFDTYVKPYKNCCLRAVIDILDWDRTILKRMKYVIVPSHFTQQYVGEQDHSYKTVSVTFSVVADISDNWKPQ